MGISWFMSSTGDVARLLNPSDPKRCPRTGDGWRPTRLDENERWPPKKVGDENSCIQKYKYAYLVHYWKQTLGF